MNLLLYFVVFFHVNFKLLKYGTKYNKLFIQSACFVLDNTCRAPRITSILSTWSGDNLCLLLVNITPPKLNRRSVPDDVAGIDKIRRVRRFKLGNLTDARSLD